MHEHRSCFSLDLYLLTKWILIRKYRFRGFCSPPSDADLGRALSQLLFTNTPSNRKKVHLAQCTISKAHGQHPVFSNESKTPFQLKFVHKWFSSCFPFFPQPKIIFIHFSFTPCFPSVIHTSLSVACLSSWYMSTEFTNCLIPSFFQLIVPIKRQSMIIKWLTKYNSCAWPA